MPLKIKITFMGTGSSIGIPALGCHCPVCSSENPKNNRTRPGICISFQNKNTLIDVTPDFRAQALKHGIDRVDSVLLTHAHADHILGMDDLRIVTEFHKKSIPVYASKSTMESLQYFFGYLFQQKIWKTDLPRLEEIIISSSGFSVSGLPVEPISVMHNQLPVTGYRFGDVAYITDVSYIPEEALLKLKNLKLLIISVIRKSPHPKHMPLDDVVDIIKTLAPERALLTHLSHELEHEELDRFLPELISPAYDGMVVEI